VPGRTAAAARGKALPRARRSADAVVRGDSFRVRRSIRNGMS
jgi:hypothetical protein